MTISVNPRLGGKGNQRILIAQSHIAVPYPADTNQNTLATIVIPANSMGPNGCLILDLYATVNNDASAKTLRITFGGTNFAVVNLASTVSWRANYCIRNRGATNSQIMYPSSASYSTNANVAVTSAIDTSVDQNLVLSMQLADGTDTGNLESYIVELINS